MMEDIKNQLVELSDKFDRLHLELSHKLDRVDFELGLSNNVIKAVISFLTINAVLMSVAIYKLFTM